MYKCDILKPRYGLRIYSECFVSLSDARKFEWKLKYTPAGGKLKKQLVSGAGGSSNGRTAAFEAVNLGSNPSPPAPDGREVRLMAPRPGAARQAWVPAHRAQG